MRHRARAALAFALALGAGCSQLPEYRRPATLATAVDPVYPADVAPGGTGPSAPDIAWRDFFTDPRLQSLIAQSLETNRDLAVAVLRIEEARAQFRIVRSERLPGVNLSASARYSDSTGGGGAGGGTVVTDPTIPTDPGNGSGGGSTTGGAGGRRYSLSIGVPSYELDFWGRVRSLTEAARAAYLQTVEARRAFQISLIADVADAYLADRAFAERAGLAEATIRSRRQSLRFAQRLYEEGEGSLVEVAQERALLGQAEIELAVIRRQQLQNRNLLQLLVGRGADPALPAARALGQQGLIAGIPAGLPSDLLANRPDILAAEQVLVAANANIGAARAAFFPRITLTGSLGFANEDLDNLFSTGPVWSFVPSLLQPIFDAGRNRANLDLTRARERIAVAQYERAIQVAFREVADALAARRFLAQEIAAQRSVAAAQAERVRLADLRFEAGLTSAIDVLDARRELFAAQQTLIDSRRAELANAVTLYAALGGGLR